MEKYLVKTVNNIEADATGNVDGTALGFIPLTGTTVGNPITGDIEIQDGLKIFPTIDGGGYYLGDNEGLIKQYLRYIIVAILIVLAILGFWYYKKTKKTKVL